MKMRNFYFLKCFLCAVGLVVLGSCSSDGDTVLGQEEGTGFVSFSLNTDAAFGGAKTKAVNEEPYKEAGNYTVQVLTTDGNVVKDMEWKYSEIPADPIPLSFGSYTVKAFYGSELTSAVSQTELYSEGVSDLQMNASETKEVEVTCHATCAKFTVIYDEAEIKKYFKNFELKFVSKATNGGSYLIDANPDPFYLKVEEGGETVEISYLFTGDGTYKSTSATSSIVLKPGQAKSATIKPNVSSTTGKLNLTITVDDKVDEVECPLEIPSDWE